MKDIIKKTTEDFLKASGFDGNVFVSEDESGFKASIESEDAPFLIGQGGANLICVQQLVQKIVAKKAKESETTPLFTLDVNGYRASRTDLLKEMAKDAAEKVLSEGRPVFMQAMNSFERRVVHLCLSEYHSLETESQGEDPDRRIIVKLKNII